jgi:cold shock CspA family protein
MAHDFLKNLKRRPSEFLNDWALKNDKKLQYERLPPGQNKELWRFRLIVSPRDNDVSKKFPWLTKCFYGRGLFQNHERAKDSVSTYVLFKTPGWQLGERLHQPFCAAYMELKAKKDARKDTIATREDGEVPDDRDESCSLGSFNTGFSCETDRVKLHGCDHYNERVRERRITLHEQQLCLKYGSKTIERSGVASLRTVFELGSIRIVQEGPEQGATAVTAIRIAHPRYERKPVLASISEEPVFKMGETLRGIVNSVKRDRNFGFIETHKGSIFFHKENTEFCSLPDCGAVVSFEVDLSKKNGLFFAKEVQVLASEMEIANFESASKSTCLEKPCLVRNWLNSHSGSKSTKSDVEDPFQVEFRIIMIESSPGA